MTCSIKAVKTKILGIVILCIFFYIFIFAYQSKSFHSSIGYVLCGTVGCTENMTEISRGRSQYQRYFNSDMDTIKQNKTNLSTRTASRMSEGVNTTTKVNGYLKNITAGSMNSSTNKIIRVAKVTMSEINNTKIGILIPSTTRRVKNPLLETLSLVTICLPSIYKTVQMEYAYTIYVGIDRGDYLETMKDKLEKMFDGVNVVVTTSRSFTKTVNALARTAYQDGMDYLVRINDDTTFETKNWTSEGLDVLRHYTPPNIGVVGPTCREGNTAILTHDMVHRTHLEIFDFYYPPYFDNWWIDDWITEVYKPKRSFKLKSWVVKHHVSSQGTRYKVDFKKKARLSKTLAFDRERLSEHLSTLKR